MSDICVIFDLDGTLVDSETLGCQAFLDLLPALTEPVGDLTERYRGRRLTGILADLEARLGVRLPDDFEPAYRQRVASLFASELKPMPGVAAMLDELTHPRCIASSGPPAKIRQALEVCGLTSHFGDRLFSSHDIGSWKPDPGLFLHAAREMGFAPAQCVVIEDSEVGVTAARAAGMRVFQYVPDRSAASPEAAIVIHDMTQLSARLALL